MMTPQAIKHSQWRCRDRTHGGFMTALGTYKSGAVIVGALLPIRVEQRSPSIHMSGSMSPLRAPIEVATGRAALIAVASRVDLGATLTDA